MGHPARLSAPVVGPATIVLVRHGESTWIVEGRFQGRLDPPLSPLGERQAALAASRLADPAAAPPLPVPAGRPVAVWHSPLRRAARTAELVAAAQTRPLELRATPAFIEVGQGDWEGRTNEEIVALDGGVALEGWRRDPTRVHAPGGEPLLDAAARVRDGLASLLETLAGSGDDGSSPESPVASAVGALDRASRVAGYPTSAGPRHPWAIVVAHDGIFRLILMSLLQVPYERFWSFPFVLCGISVIEIRGGRASLRAHNLADHLAPLASDPRGAAEAKGDRRGAL